MKISILKKKTYVQDACETFRGEVKQLVGYMSLEFRDQSGQNINLEDNI